MIIIPGFVISALTFPGVIVHEMAHQLFCRLCRVSVFEVCYFQLGNPAGYVLHETPSKPYQQILIGIGPFFVNSILGPLIVLPAAMPIGLDATHGLQFVQIWLGVSIAMHAFPSTGDAESIWKGVMSQETGFLTKLLTVPIVGFIYLGAVGSFFWLDLIYGGLIAFALPAAFSGWLVRFLA